MCLERCTKTLSHLPEGTREMGPHVYRAPLGCPTTGTDRVRPYILAHPAGHTCRKVALPIPFALVGDRVLPCDAYMEKA